MTDIKKEIEIFRKKQLSKSTLDEKKSYINNIKDLYLQKLTKGTKVTIRYRNSTYEATLLNDVKNNDNSIDILKDDGQHKNKVDMINIKYIEGEDELSGEESDEENNETIDEMVYSAESEINDSDNDSDNINGNIENDKTSNDEENDKTSNDEENDKTSNDEENHEADIYQNIDYINVSDNVKFILSSYTNLSKLNKKSVKMIYCDPPFNSNRNYTLSENDTLGFTDKWSNDEKYEKIITDLINVMYGLLMNDGTLFFHISSDQMFIPEKILRNKFKFVTPIFWKKCRSKNNVKKKLGTTIDIIFKCNKISNPLFNLVLQEKDKHYLDNSFKNKDERGNYSLGHIVTEKTKVGHIYSITFNDKQYNPPSGWRINKDKLQDLYNDNRIHFPVKKKSNLYKKIYLHENPGKACTDLWDDIHSISQGNEKRLYPTEKPIKLLERLISISTNEGDMCLDPMCGSGTTGKACINLNRKCILNDINKDVVDIVKQRLVIT